MQSELKPLTESGKRMVELAEKHAEEFSELVEEHDREGVFAVENVSAMRKSGFSASAVPSQLGGLGVTSVHDMVIAMSRLGRGDPSTALAFNMHLFRSFGLARAYRTAKAAGNQVRQQRLESRLGKIGSGEMIIAVANSEEGADNRTSGSKAVKMDDGWLLSGSKRFATGSTGADVLAVRTAYENQAGEQRLASALIPTDRPGLKIMENWDALGMRASGSHDVILTDCFVKDEEFDDIGPFGTFNAPLLAGNSGASMGLASVFLGIAEKAHQFSVDSFQERHRVTQYTDRHQAQYPMNQVICAENEIDLAACRGILARATQAYDDTYQTSSSGATPSISDAEAFLILKNTACVKKFVTERAIGIVDRSMTLLGGAGFLSRSTMSRLYRDVRAGPLMQPWASNQAVELIGKVTLGIDPNVS